MLDPIVGQTKTWRRPLQGSDGVFDFQSRIVVCPDCYALVEIQDTYNHEGWHKPKVVDL